MLKRVSIQNFKSLKDVTLDLQKINLLIGPNNSGKTNFLKALEFVSDSIGGEIKITKQYRYKKNIDNLPGIHLIFNSIDRKEKYDHVLVSSEGHDEEDEEIGFALISFANSFDMSDAEVPLEDIDWKEFDTIFGSFDIYKIDPNKLDKPGPIGQGADAVNADASNLIAFLDYILNEYRNTSFKQIEEDLQKCVPEFTEINLQNVESTQELLKQYGDKTFKRLGLTDGRQNIKYWADELSEGTLYFIALLCIINQPNPPKLLLLEEPEKGIHPRRIYEVMQFIFGLVDDKDIQVIMTTHSPTVVDMFKDMPESVFIFDKDEEGATYIKNLQKDIIEPETIESEQLGIDPPQYLNGLGQAWKVGFIGGVPR